MSTTGWETSQVELSLTGGRSGKMPQFIERIVHVVVTDVVGKILGRDFGDAGRMISRYTIDSSFTATSLYFHESREVITFEVPQVRAAEVDGSILGRLLLLNPALE